MGCAVNSMLQPYTQEEIDNLLAGFVPRLPVAVLMNGGIVKLEGANGFFNPNSLLDPSWLKGKMTKEEFAEAINYINKCTAHAEVGLNRVYSVSERPIREQMCVQAGMAAVEEINQRHTSVRFTHQLTAENMQISTTGIDTPAPRMAQRHRPAVANATAPILYISVVN